MSMSNPLRRWWHLGVAGGIPLLALALGTGEAGARSLEREIGSGAAQKGTAARSAATENRKAAPVNAPPVGTRNHDPCCADEPPVPRARVGAPSSQSRIAPAPGSAQPSLRGASPSASPGTPEIRPTGARSLKRGGEGKPVPRHKPGEQRRGGVGSLIGITFA